jgi:hypothetical protein
MSAASRVADGWRWPLTGKIGIVYYFPDISKKKSISPSKNIVISILHIDYQQNYTASSSAMASCFDQLQRQSPVLDGHRHTQRSAVLKQQSFHCVHLRPRSKNGRRRNFSETIPIG